MTVNNKSLRQNWKIFNKVSLRPIGIDVPDKYDNQDKWCEDVWNHLCDDNLVRLNHWIRKGRKGYSITLWTDTEYLYLVQVVRTEYNTDETSIFMAKYTENNYSDFKAIAKVIHKNIEEIISHSKNAVIEWNKIAAAEDIKDELDA